MPSAPCSGPEPRSAPTRSSALDRIEAEQLGPELAVALALLSPVERDAPLLHACGELTYAEIARATAVAIGTVGSPIHRARTQSNLYTAARGD